MSSRTLPAAVLCGILLLLNNSPLALAQTAPADDCPFALQGEDPAPSDPMPLAGEPACGAPRWTASAEMLVWDRVGSVNQSLVSIVPDSVSFGNLATASSTEMLNATGLSQGFARGPRVGLTYHGDSGYDLELSYFQLDGWNAQRSVGPYDWHLPQNYWLVMQAPGGFLQAQDNLQSMQWDYASRLYNAELNVRWHPSDWLTTLAGFRWLNLGENLQGELVPIDGFPPFWNTSTCNNLFGFQIGGEGKIWQRGRFSLTAQLKAGIYDNNVDQDTGISLEKRVRPLAASTNHAAFVGETGLQLKYQINSQLAFKVGYEALWLEGVALAPGQIQETWLTSHTSEIARGVNCDSGVFYHGANAGLEYSF